MNRTKSTILVLGALMAVGAPDVAAQAEPNGRGPDRRGPGVETIMQMRDRLELTEAQIAQLDQIRRETVARRSEEMAEMAELRSRLRAGQIQRSEVMAHVEERREANAGQAEELRARVEGVLTEEQLETVEQMRTRATAFRRGRQSVRRPRGGLAPRARVGPRRRSWFEPGR